MACNISGRASWITASIASRRDRDPGMVAPAVKAGGCGRFTEDPGCLGREAPCSIGTGRSYRACKETGKRAMTAQATPEGTPKGAWKITFLLFLFMLVNFADKIVVGLAGVPIMAELKLEPEQFGLLGSSFFLLF